MKKQEKKDFGRYVLKAQSKNKMVFNNRNAPNKNGLYKFFDKIEDHMDDATDAGLKINDAIIRYSNVGKADSCDELWNGCDEIRGQLKNQSQVHGVVDVSLCKQFPNQPAQCKSFSYRKGSPAPF